jgi:hypothetical protein
MPHNTKQLICHSLLHHFDPARPEYLGSRDHFTPRQLATLDEMRAREENEYAKFSFKERCFIGWAILHLLTVKNPQDHEHDDD